MKDGGRHITLNPGMGYLFAPEDWQIVIGQGTLSLCIMRLLLTYITCRPA